MYKVTQGIITKCIKLQNILSFLIYKVTKCIKCKGFINEKRKFYPAPLK